MPVIYSVARLSENNPGTLGLVEATGTGLATEVLKMVVAVARRCSTPSIRTGADCVRMCSMVRQEVFEIVALTCAIV